MTADRSRRGGAVVNSLYGGRLYQQGRGYYVPLELFAILQGTLAAGEPLLPGPEIQVPRYRRRSHDFARRLAFSAESIGESELSALGETDGSAERTATTLHTLLKGLVVEIPGRRRIASWPTVHLYPYIGDLVHYDAVERGREANRAPAIETYLYRGGGALVHKILRTDPDAARLEETKRGFTALLSDSDSSLGSLSRALLKLDLAEPNMFSDELEGHARVHHTRYIEPLRAGVSTILGGSSANAEKSEALMHFVPFCIALHQLARSREILGSDADLSLCVDCQATNSPVRELSRRDLRRSAHDVYDALAEAARQADETELLDGSQTWRTGPRTFFTTTLYASGLSNAASGDRWFTLRPVLLDAIVHALVPNEIEFDEFCGDVLWRRLGLVIGGRAARDADLLDRVDGAAFEQNADDLRATLREMGLLREPSDATAMVGGLRK